MQEFIPEFVSISFLMGAIIALIMVLIARAFTGKKVKPLTPAALIHISIQNLEEYKKMIEDEHISFGMTMTSDQVIQILDERRNQIDSTNSIIKELTAHLERFPN